MDETTSGWGWECALGEDGWERVVIGRMDETTPVWGWKQRCQPWGREAQEEAPAVMLPVYGLPPAFSPWVEMDVTIGHGGGPSTETVQGDDGQQGG